MNVQVLQVGDVPLLLALDVVLSEGLEPSVHAVDLELVLALAVALVDVALGPLSETSGDLLDADHGIVLVVSHESLLVVEAAVGWVLV